MVSNSRRTWRVRRVGLALCVALSAGILVPVAASAAPSPAPSPTLEAAQARRAAADAAVGELTRQVAAAQTAVASEHARSQVAEQQYAYQRQLLDAARTAEDHARIDHAAAQIEVDTAQAELSTLVRDHYENGRALSIASLFTARDAGAVLDGLAYERQVSTRRAVVTEQLRAALVQVTALERATSAALAAQAAATTAARTALQIAHDAGTKAHDVEAELARVLAAAERDQRTAAAAVALAGSRARATRERDLLSSRYRAIAQVTAGSPLPPDAGHWTREMADAVVDRALRLLGMPYSFAAGNAFGPTYGVAADYASRNDAHVFGLDCSGLSLYAWAPYLALDHFAATQYSQAGHVHPAVADLEPGDLVFWSANGRPSGIGHVALYVGSGNVVQAPQSGDIIKISPLLDVEPGLFGATRPLT